MVCDDITLAYGLPPLALSDIPAGAVQTSPLIPGSARLEDVAPCAASEAVVLAPPAVLERRYVLALTLRALKPGGRLTVLAPKDRGGSRLGKELADFGCQADETAKRHHRICELARPAEPVGLDIAIADGAPRDIGGLSTQPGVFSWDRLDAGTQLLLKTLPPLGGKVADLGSGLGLLARAVLAEPKVESLELVELDRRAVDASRRNIDDGRARFHWADARGPLPFGDLDVVVMNPPFHAAGVEDKALGQAFLRRAHELLRRGGKAYIVANRHLPYEKMLGELFAKVEQRADAGGYKVLEVRK